MPAPNGATEAVFNVFDLNTDRGDFLPVPPVEVLADSERYLKWLRHQYCVNREVKGRIEYAARMHRQQAESQKFSGQRAGELRKAIKQLSLKQG